MTAPKTRPRTGPLRWFLRGGWYPFVIVLSLGILSFVPFTHAALRTRRALMWLWTVLYSAAVIALFTMSDRTQVGGYAMGLMIIASIHSLALRRQVWSSGGAQPIAVAGPDPAGRPVDPAVEAVLAGRARRISYAAVEDVFSVADIPYPLWDRIRDRAVVIAG
jgi:hypothetical protein